MTGKVLAALLKEQMTKDETLQTLLCEVETIISGRPLTKVSDDPRDLEALTPNHLLLLRSGPILSPGIFKKEDSYARRRWRQVQYMADQFWGRWTREYLPLLKTRQKWNGSQRNLAVGDVVLIVDDTCCRSMCPIARVMEVMPGQHGGVWQVKVKTRTSELERPINKCVLLEAATWVGRQRVCPAVIVRCLRDLNFAYELFMLEFEFWLNIHIWWGGNIDSSHFVGKQLTPRVPPFSLRVISSRLPEWSQRGKKQNCFRNRSFESTRRPEIKEEFEHLGYMIVDPSAPTICTKEITAMSNVNGVAKFKQNSLEQQKHLFKLEKYSSRNISTTRSRRKISDDQVATLLTVVENDALDVFATFAWENECDEKKINKECQPWEVRFLHKSPKS